MYKKICMVMVVVLSGSTQNVCSLSGKLDTTFNAGGIQPGTVSTTIDNFATGGAQSVAIQQDGKIVVAGSISIGGVSRFAVARFNVNGTLDAIFNASGAQPGTLSTTIENSPENCLGNSVAIQQDGKIVVAGNVTIGGVQKFAVARFNTNGTLDTTFNPAPAPQPGTASTTVNNGNGANGVSVGIQQDGKIVISGLSFEVGGTKLGVARFNTNGTLDTTFNPAPAPQPGTVSTFIENNAAINGGSLGIQKDGKIVVVGAVAIGGQNRFALARFNTDGTLDTTFHAAGVQPGTTSTTIDNGAAQGNSVAIQQDGKIVAGGFVSVGKFAVARFNTDGALDTTFNTLGVQPGTVSTTIDNSFAQEFSVAIQQDGKIVEGGIVSVSGVLKFAVARFNPNGTLDTTFNPSGIQPGTVSTTIDNNVTGLNFGISVAIQQDGKIVEAGQVVFIDGATKFGVVRFLGVATNNLCSLRLIEKYGPRLLL